MKFLLDFFPIALFFLAFKLFDIYTATAVAIAATLGQIAWLRFKTGRVEPMQWLSLGVIVVFGGATLLAHDETFIKWKPTVLYWLFAVILTAGSVGFRKNLIRAMMEKQMSLPEPVWSKLLWNWTGFFALMGMINLFVAYNFSTDAWVNFKLFGSMGLMLVFVFIQALMLARHIQEKPTETTEK